MTNCDCKHPTITSVDPVKTPPAKTEEEKPKMDVKNESSAKNDDDRTEGSKENDSDNDGQENDSDKNDSQDDRREDEDLEDAHKFLALMSRYMKNLRKRENRLRREKLLLERTAKELNSAKVKESGPSGKGRRGSTAT
ncbi:hypothetical protein GQ44DRAFT_774857 [Phaeosphaeriaceae sp. PMI808]|nr:hypothetical protein GQ44DRAFT_774857 [Phaeosphaeriaceae sp. PMI808]